MSSGGSLRAGHPATLAGIENFGQASRRYVAILGVAVGILAVWQVLRATLRLPAYKLPNPWNIVTACASTTPNGQLIIISLAHDLLVTRLEAALLFALGGAAGFGVAVVFAQSRLLEHGLLPYIIMSQTIPSLAVAPMEAVGIRNSINACHT